MACSLLALSTHAQPTLTSDTVVASAQVAEVMLSSVRLSSTRFATVGYSDTLGGVVSRPLLYLTDAHGRVLRKRLWRLPGNEMARLSDVLPARTGFQAFYPDSPPSPPHTRPNEIWIQFDTLGNTLSQRTIVADTQYNRRQYHSLPAGLLSVGTGVGRSSINQTEVRRLDAQGQVMWQRRMGYWSHGAFIRPLLDGSFVVVATDPTQYGPVTQNLFRYDYKLYRVTASGGVLDSAWVGEPSAWESPFQVKPTTDGGLLICGFESPSPASNPRRGTLIKLDSAFRQQWKYTIYDQCCDSESGAEIYDAWETSSGHYVVQGAANGYQPFLREIIPPAVFGQPATMGWNYVLPALPSPQARSISYLLYESGNPAYGFGSFDADFFAPAPTNNPDFYQCRLTGLPVPALLDYCHRPPSRPVTTVGAIIGDSLRFTVDPMRQLAGPRYAEISLVEWNFGDGTLPQFGWDVWHRFALPAPVTVRLRVCNNLGCCRDTVLYPFGVPTGLPSPAASPRVQVFPNPSASGSFSVRMNPEEVASSTGTYEVVDATGRRLINGALAGASLTVDLHSQSAGVYTLRLTWTDGRVAVRRLVRW